MRIFYRTALLLLLTAALCLGIGGVALAATYEGEGSATPEEAVALYLEGVQEESLPKMLSAFAIETYAAGFDWGAQLERIKMYSAATMNIKFPKTNPLFEAINVEARKSEIVGGIAVQFTAFQMPEMDYYAPVTFTGDDADAQVAAFVQQFEETTRSLTLAKLIPVGFVEPSLLSEIYEDERNQGNLAKLAAIYGADEIQSKAACLMMSGKPYLLCCDTIRYGEKWYMLGLGGNIGQILGLSVTSGGITPFSFN